MTDETKTRTVVYEDFTEPLIVFFFSCKSSPAQLLLQIYTVRLVIGNILVGH